LHNNDFYPVSFSKLCEIMQDRPDNPNFVGNNAHSGAGYILSKPLEYAYKSAEINRFAWYQR
jgi:hypothetical protein